MNFNQAILLGRLTQDPQIRVLPSGQNVASFGLATNNFYKDQSGEKKKTTEFHNVVVFGRSADVASQYLKKGMLCLVIGRIQTRTWQAQDGRKMIRTEIIANRIQLGPRLAKAMEETVVPEETDIKEGTSPAEEEINVEDIPF